MPFVKKTDSQEAQPPVEVRRQFIGRMGELRFFVQNILKPEEPCHGYLDDPFQNKHFGYGTLAHFSYLQRLIFSKTLVF